MVILLIICVIGAGILIGIFGILWSKYNIKKDVDKQDKWEKERKELL